MASSMLPIRPMIGGIRASATPSTQKSDTTSLRAAKSTTTTSWWTPLFGWSSDPDYIDSSSSSSSAEKNASSSSSSSSVLVVESSSFRSGGTRFNPGCFTEEKAKQLRLRTMETETFHDIMYHSAIASRLASDLPNRADR